MGEFKIRIGREEDGWWVVEITDQHGGEFAKTFSRASPYSALREALSYMECVVQDVVA